MATGRAMRAVGYIRVSTNGQAEEGAGLDAQRSAIEKEASHRGWELVAVFEDMASGKSMRKRPGLEDAITYLEAGHADVLVVAKLDRLSRSLLDFAALVERSQRKRWTLAAIDLQVDTSTPAGEMMANVLAVFAQFERRVIGQRTKEGLAAKRKKTAEVGYDTKRGGLKGPIGRKRRTPDDVIRRIQDERAAGRSFAAIAGQLTADGVPTAQGGSRWWPSTVRKAAAAAA
jgi:DNA invertase Pin-like site-specific DNA recombinase